MIMEDMKVWLVLGFVPYRIHKECLPGGLYCFEVYALFWVFNVKLRPSGRNDWTLRISLIDKVRQAVWAAVTQFKDNKLRMKVDMLDDDITAG